MKRSKSTIIVVLGALLILGGGIGVFLLAKKAQDQVLVTTAKAQLPPYQSVTEAQLVFAPVSRSSVRESDITKEEYLATFAKNKRALIPTLPVLEGNRIDERAVAGIGVKSFAGVSEDEQVVAANASVSGSAIGTIRAGDVVDVHQDTTSGGSGGTTVPFVKVLCVSTSPSGCRGVLPPGVELEADQQSAGSALTGSGAKGITVLLAVPAASAGDVAGKDVSLSLLPFCQFNDSGSFTDAREDRRCPAPADRAATTGTNTSAPDAPEATTGDAEAPQGDTATQEEGN